MDPVECKSRKMEAMDPDKNMDQDNVPQQPLQGKCATETFKIEFFSCNNKKENFLTSKRRIANPKSRDRVRIQRQKADKTILCYLF